jgi:tetratricopeptide (TPR) repeat protein
MWGRAFSLVAAAAILSCATTARADDDNDRDPDMEIARGHFEKGRRFYEAHKYPEALEQFLTARRVKPLSAFDYNIARCYDRMEQVAEAIASYQAFLKNAIDPDEIKEVRARLVILKPRLPPPSPTGPVRLPSHPSLGPPIAMLLVAVVIAATGTALVASVSPDLATLQQKWAMQPSDALEQQAADLKTRAIAGYALWGVAGAAAAIDLALWIRWGLWHRDAPKIAIVPSLSGIAIGGRF